MDRPCSHAIKCPGPLPGLDSDYPVTNYSSEYTDGADFTSIRYPFSDPYDPRLPAWWSAQSCLGLCTSLVSQDDADACAQRMADLCSWTSVPNTPPTGLGDTDPQFGCLINPPSCMPPSVPVFYNVAQQCGYPCPDGSIFYWLIPAGWIVATSQSLADEVAHNLACERAAIHHVCLGSVSGAFCKGVAGSKTLSVSGNIGPYTFSIVGGSLPPGLALQSSGSLSASIIGVPTLGGDYSVTIRATDRLGSYAQKSYTISVMQITNSDPLPQATVGVAYSEQLNVAGGTAPYTFTLDSGTLPDGLTLSSSGLISGTPTTAETKDFGVLVSCSAGTCVQALSLEVTGGCPTYLRTIPIAGTTQAINVAAHTTNPTNPRTIFVGRSTDIVVVDRETELVIANVNNTAATNATYGEYCTAAQVVVASLFANQKLQFINAVTYASLGELDHDPIGVGYSHLVYHSGNSELICNHVTATELFSLERWNPATVSHIGNIAISDLYGIAYGAAENRVYVTTWDGITSTVKVYNAAYALVATWNINPANSPDHIAYAEGYNKVYVLENSGGASWSIEVLNTLTGAIVATIALPAYTGQPNLKWCNGFIGVSGSAGASVRASFINPATDTVECFSAIPGANTGLIGIDDTGRVYISQGGGSGVNVLQ